MKTTYTFTPIGIIETPFETQLGTPIQPAAAHQIKGCIVLEESFIPGIKDLDGFSHIVLLYIFDRSKPAKMTVQPFMDSETRGLFATRAPARPNPIGISTVKLDKIVKNRIYFFGADMLNKTPLLDIKPHVPAFGPGGPFRFGWLSENIRKMETTKDDGRFSD